MKAKNSTNDSRTDWARLKKMSDEDIDVSDAPELDAEFFRTAVVRMPRAKKAVSIRLDQDVWEGADTLPARMHLPSGGIWGMMKGNPKGDLWP